MYHFFETLKVIDGEIQNLKFHNKRLNSTIKKIYNIHADIDLKEYINQKDLSLERCKVIYSKKVESIEFFPLKPRTFKSFKIINSDIEYPFKSTNREELNTLFEQREKCDDIIIVKDGLISDTTIANIAIFDGLKWYTPKNPLLYGTQRAKLLKDKMIIEKDIKLKDMKNIVHFAIINALVGFHKIYDVKFKY
jgi:4-amino-4-deoxychorismate lyase